MPYRRSNYDFVIDSSFQPFSFQEMLTPFVMYKDAFERDEAAYEDLTNRADKFKYLSETLPEGSKARQIYEGYANELNAQATDLAHNGLSMNGRSALLGLKRRYQGEIGRLEQVDAIRKAQIKEQNALRQQDPTKMFSRRADQTSFDAYLENPDLTYDSYSGALLTQQVGTAASAIAKGLNDAIQTGKLDNYTKTWIESHGYSVNDVRQAMLNPASDKTGVLASIVREAVESSGIPKWGNPEIEAQAYRWANQGLWQAIGQSQVHQFEDYGARLSAQEAKERRMAAYNHNLKLDELEQAARMQNQNLSMNINPKFDRRNVRTTAEVAADIKDKEMLEKYGKYFYRKDDGTYVLNYEGRKKYKETPNKYKGVHSTATDTAETEFKEWLDSRGLSEMAKGRTGKTQNDILAGIFNRAHNIYDSTTAGEYTGLIDSSQYDNVIGTLNRASNNGTLKNYERRKKGNSYEFVPKDDVDVSKLTNADIKSAVPVYGIHGNFLEVTLKGGDRITVPYSNLNTNYNGMVAGNVNDAHALELFKQNGTETFTYSDGRTVPIDVAITDALNQGFSNFMSGLGTSTVEPQKTDRNLYQMR